MSELTPENELPDHLPVRETIFFIQVCSRGSEDEALACLRSDNPAGTRNNWIKSDDTQHKPVQCADYPNRKHYVFAA